MTTINSEVDSNDRKVANDYDGGMTYRGKMEYPSSLSNVPLGNQVLIRGVWYDFYKLGDEEQAKHH
jgi:hypothetical protein